MENKKSTKILLILIIILFSILFYYWLKTFEIIKLDEKTVSKVTNEEELYEENEQTNKKSKNTPKYENIENKTYNVLSEEQIAEMYDKINNKQDIVTEEHANSADKIDTSKFYYTQIDDTAKIIYDKLNENKENLKSGNYKIEFGDTFKDVLNKNDGENLLKNSYTQALRAFLFDNPDIFFLDVTKLCLMTETTSFLLSKTYNVFITPQDNKSYLSSQFQTEAIVNLSINEVKQVLDNIKESTKEMSVEEKIKYVHDYLVKNTEYDESMQKSNIHNIYGTLVKNTAVCEGYAKSFKYILDELDIPSIIVVGRVTNSERRN